jgi:dihydropteroate synthase
VLADVIAFLAERLELARSRGVDDRQLIVDPGPDFAKTPTQTIELLRGARRLHEFGRPLLFAVSRKDFVGALTGRSPRGRGAGTLAALAYGMDLGAQIFRVHDVAAAADFVTVLATLRGEQEIPPSLALPDELRWERPDQQLE